MRYCGHCGKQIMDEAVICVHCGCSVEKKKEGDKKSPLWFLLGFILPIVGLILYCVWKNEYPLRAKSIGKGALVSVIVSVVIGIIYLIIIVAMMGSMLGSMYY